MMSIRISLIVPVYNDKEYLDKSLPPLINQTVDDYELILVDDGSSDGSSDILDKFAGNNEKIKVLHKKNGGVSSARNAGIKVAAGDWIVFADSDDVVSKDYLKNLYDQVEDCDIAWHGETKVYDNGVALSASCVSDKKIDMSNPAEATMMINNTWLTNFPGPVCKIYRRDLFISHGIFMEEDMVFGEDFHCLLRLLEKCRYVKMISGCSQDYLYYQNSDSITYSTDSFEQEFISFEKLATEISHFMDKTGIIGEFKIFNSSLFVGKQRVIKSLYSKNNKYSAEQRHNKLKYLKNCSVSNHFFHKQNKLNTLATTAANFGAWRLVDELAKKGYLF